MMAMKSGISKAASPAKRAAGDSKPAANKFEELTAPQFTAAMSQTSLVFFPVGSLEFHGPHLPLGTDAIHAYEFCIRVAQVTGGVVLPVTYWGALGHEGWPGSLLISENTFRALVKDIFRLLAEHKVKLVIATTGHWPARQGKTLAEIAQQSMKEYPSTKILALDPYSVNPEDQTVGHGGKKETSLMLAMRADLVHMDKLVGGEDVFKGIGADCVEGNSRFGRRYFESSVKQCAALVLQAMQDQKS
jgi:creatinine amidohydrolase